MAVLEILVRQGAVDTEVGRDRAAPLDADSGRAEHLQAAHRPYRRPSRQIGLRLFDVLAARGRGSEEEGEGTEGQQRGQGLPVRRFVAELSREGWHVRSLR